MKYTTPAAFRAALLERLRAEGARIGMSPEQLRKRVVFERLLARLLTVAPSRWVLKGGIGLSFRHPGPLRTTRDLDLLGPNDSGLVFWRSPRYPQSRSRSSRSRCRSRRKCTRTRAPMG